MFPCLVWEKGVPRSARYLVSPGEVWEVIFRGLKPSVTVILARILSSNSIAVTVCPETIISDYAQWTQQTEV